MSSLLCFICHNDVNADTNDGIREKYREIVGMNLCPDSHLCYICCHLVNKLWLFKSVCVKRSLEYPVLFSDKCNLNLHRKETDYIVLCSEDNCLTSHSANVFLQFNNDIETQSNDYVELEEERNDLDDYFKEKTKNCVFSKGFYSGGVNLDAILTDTVNDEVMLTGFENNLDNVHDCLVNNDYSYTDDMNFDVNRVVESDVGLKIEPDIIEIKNIDEPLNNRVADDDKNNEPALATSNAIEKLTINDKRKSNDKRLFAKTLLSVEDQKAELETQRKGKKYMGSEFKCYNCALGFLFKDSYQAHMMRHEESNGEFVCELCTLRFASARVLRAHCASHRERHSCSRCGIVIRTRQRDSHARLCHMRPSGGASCHLCGSVFQDSKALQQHLKRFHFSKTSNRTYSCSVCGETYNNQAAVRTHMIKHIQRKFACDQCPANFSSPYTLTQHKKKHADGYDKREHMCVTCGVAYASRKCLLAHMRNSLRHQDKTYDCTICNRVCPNARALSLHMTRVHSTSKDYACTRCNNKYTSRQSLARHVKEHTTPRDEIKLAQCDICGKGFKTNSKLNRHIREVCKKNAKEREPSAPKQNNTLP